MDGTSQDSEIEKAFRLLCQGFSTVSHSQIYTAHKALYQIGAPAVPKIVAYLESMDVSELKSKNHSALLTGLLALLNDIDESKAREVGMGLLLKECDNAAAQLIKKVLRFTLSDYNLYQLGSITVCESKSLNSDGLIKRKLCEWVDNVPPDDIAGLERLYVVPYAKQDYGGTYTPILFNITIVWFEELANENFMSNLALFEKEKTFYHEVGHHRHRHTFGQQSSQEKEANAYAYRILRKSRPRLMGVLSFVHRLIPGWLHKKINDYCRAQQRELS